MTDIPGIPPADAVEIVGIVELQGEEPGRRLQTDVFPLLVAAGMGAILMYFLDPGRGRRRRRLVRDKVVHAAHAVGDAASTTGRDLANHARGLAVAARRPLASGDEEDDAVIHERVRSELGRVVSHPGAIEVRSQQGMVTLLGPVLEREAGPLLARVKRVRGVRAVEDQLDRHETAGNVPALQGSSRPRAPRAELRQENWTPTARLLVGVAGGTMLGSALRGRARDRGLLDAALGMAGAALMLRAATNMPFDRMVGVGAGRKAVTVQDSITIGAPVDEVYAWLVAWEHWPHWMSHVREVRFHRGAADGLRTHWTVDGPAGTTVQWDAEVTRMVPNELIAWKTLDGALVKHAGRIRLTPTDEGQTRVDVQLSYNPVLGAAGHAVATLLGRDPGRQLNDDMARLKTTIETGVAPRDAAAVREAEAGLEEARAES